MNPFENEPLDAFGKAILSIAHAGMIEKFKEVLKDPTRKQEAIDGIMLIETELLTSLESVRKVKETLMKEDPVDKLSSIMCSIDCLEKEYNVLMEELVANNTHLSSLDDIGHNMSPKSMMLILELINKGKEILSKIHDFENSITNVKMDDKLRHMCVKKNLLELKLDAELENLRKILRNF